MWEMIGGLCAGLGLMWSVYHWVLDRRDKAHRDEMDKLFKTFWASEDRNQKIYEAMRHDMTEGLKAISRDIMGISRKLNDTMLALAEERGKTSELKDKFREYVEAVNRTIDRHERKIDELGKIIYVGKDK